MTPLFLGIFDRNYRNYDCEKARMQAGKRINGKIYRENIENHIDDPDPQSHILEIRP
jgi:hypothetical protein